MHQTGQNLWECGMLKGDFRKAAHGKQGVLASDLNGRNMENIIHLNRFIFLVDGTKLEGTRGDHFGMRFIVFQSVALGKLVNY